MSKRGKQGRSHRPKSSGGGATYKGSGGQGPSDSSGRLWLYGTHAVIAAIANPHRYASRLVLTSEVASSEADSLASAIKQGGKENLQPELRSRKEIEPLLPPEAVHQGIALLVEPLGGYSVEELCRDCQDKESARVVILDQPNDPHNIGAVLRSAAAFGASAVIVPDRGTPEATGTVAKSACGALERIPLLRVGNLARTMELLKESGFWCIGLDGQGGKLLADADLNGKSALIFGAEGPGLRRLTKENCDFLVRVPISNTVESLNLSNAVAVTLYEATRQFSST
jgi:23S rRNA (guanosine2251-2'-O)-methyltransferase